MELIVPRTIVEYRCLLISPSDVSQEREMVASAVRGWNGRVGLGIGVRIELVAWESHSTPELRDTAQDVLNRQIVDNADFAIAIFWARLGTATRAFPSGSLEEIYRLRGAGKRVLTYFCDRPIPPTLLEGDQFQRLQAERRRLEGLGLVDRYQTADELTAKVALHLSSVIAAIHSAQATSGATETNGNGSSHTGHGHLQTRIEDLPGDPNDAEILADLASGHCGAELLKRGWISYRADGTFGDLYPGNPRRVAWPSLDLTGQSAPIWIFSGTSDRKSWGISARDASTWNDVPQAACIIALFGDLYKRPALHVIPAHIVAQRLTKLDLKEPIRSERDRHLLEDRRKFGLPSGFLEAWSLFPNMRP